MIQGILQWVPFLVVEIALFQFEIIYQTILRNLVTFASGIKEQRTGSKVLRLNARLAFSSWAHILKI